MPHETVLIATIAAGIGLAFILGFISARLGLPPLVGYLLAGIAVGPFTPGFVADAALASQLAEIGVILLMFGVGLHFSLRDLMAVRKIALPGAIVQIGAASLMGMGLSRFWGWSWSAGFVFGLCLSVASTVVLLKALEDNGVLDSINGRIAVGWLIVEDLAMVLALVLLPAFAAPVVGEVVAGAAESKSLLVTLATTLAGVVAFIVVMLVLGRRFVPWLLARVAKLGSRELFTLAVLAIALGIAVGSAALFGVSFALGAFFAGVIISESDLSHRAAADALPLQDAFAVLFFVSVGMLVDPKVIIQQPLNVLAVLAIIIIGKSIAAFVIVSLFKYPLRTALTVSASLAQIGEFSFILAGMAVAYNIMPAEGQSLILVGALLSIALNQACFAAIEPILKWFKSKPKLAAYDEKSIGNHAEDDLLPVEYDTISNHAIIVGHGRVGSWIAKALERSSIPYMVIEEDRLVVEALRRDGILAIFGDASRTGVLEQAHLSTAKLLVIATPTSYQARHILEIARRENPAIDTVVRTHSAKEQHFLRENGAGRVVMGEFELAFSMAEYALQSFGRGPEEVISTIDNLRGETLLDEGLKPSMAAA